MTKIEVELDQQTLESAKLLAEYRQSTLPELIADVIKLLIRQKITKDPWLGLVADEPELVGEILEETLKNRRVQLFKEKIGKGTA